MRIRIENGVEIQPLNFPDKKNQDLKNPGNNPG